MYDPLIEGPSYHQEEYGVPTVRPSPFELAYSTIYTETLPTEHFSAAPRQQRPSARRIIKPWTSPDPPRIGPISFPKSTPPVLPAVPRGASLTDLSQFQFTPALATSPRRTATESTIVQLVRPQSYDGSFTPSTEFRWLIGSGVFTDDAAERAGVSGTVWATALAVAFLRKHCTGEPELLELLVEKAVEYIQRVEGASEPLIQQAARLV